MAPRYSVMKHVVMNPSYCYIIVLVPVQFVLINEINSFHFAESVSGYYLRVWNLYFPTKHMHLTKTMWTNSNLNQILFSVIKMIVLAQCLNITESCNCSFGLVHSLNFIKLLKLENKINIIVIFNEQFLSTTSKFMLVYR